jgi:hypothetical protein
MLVALAMFAGFAVLLVFLGWVSAESRPAFINPNKKHQPFAGPIRLDQEEWY